jgi:hypothetical protein
MHSDSAAVLPSILKSEGGRRGDRRRHRERERERERESERERERGGGGILKRERCSTVTGNGDGLF